MVDDVVLHIFEREFALWNRFEAFHPIGDVEMRNGNVYRHERLRVELQSGRQRGLLMDYSAGREGG